MNKKDLIQLLKRFQSQRDRGDDDGNEQMDMEPDDEVVGSL